MDYIYEKIVLISKISEEIEADPNIGSYFLGCSASDTEVTIHMSQELDLSKKNTLDVLVSTHDPSPDIKTTIEDVVKNAKAFGEKLVFDFIVENVMLGITQLGLTSHVRSVTKEIELALSTGSLYDAIDLVKTINPADLDAIILTETRLLVFRNKIEEYLQIPLAQTWNE